MNYIARLMTRYETAPSDGPDAKKVKFSDIHDQLMQCDPPCTSFGTASQLIKEAFPESYGKKCGKDRNLYIFGIQPASLDTASTPHVDPTQDVSVLLAREEHKSVLLLEEVQKLQSTVRQLEETKREMEAHILKLEEVF